MSGAMLAGVCRAAASRALERAVLDFASGPGLTGIAENGSDFDVNEGASIENCLITESDFQEAMMDVNESCKEGDGGDPSLEDSVNTELTTTDNDLKKSSYSSSFEKSQVNNDDNNAVELSSSNNFTDGKESAFLSIQPDIEGKQEEVNEVDVAIVGAGIGGLCAGAILNTLYGKTVGLYESHYVAGGCAHSFERPSSPTNSSGVSFTFDSGPTILLGCSSRPYNPLRQVLNAIEQHVDWIPYSGWGMIENPGRSNEVRWKVELGPDLFENGPLKQFGSKQALQEFQGLREVTKKLVDGAVTIPTMAMRPGASALLPLLRYLPALIGLLQQGPELTQGTFAPYLNGPLYKVSDPWLRSWLDALAFSLSGLPATRTSAAAMAYVLYDMHRPGTSLDYPRGGLGTVVEALVKGVQQGSNGSRVNLRQHVESIDTSPDGSRVVGLTLRGGQKIKAKVGVICNAPVWSLSNLIKNKQAKEILNNYKSMEHRKPRQSWQVVPSTGRSYIPDSRPVFRLQNEDSFLSSCDTAEMTGSFLHLHLAIKSEGLDLDKMEAHYTVMDRSLSGDSGFCIPDGPCGELNMIAVSNPCVIDPTLAPTGFLVLHAYGAGNEPYEIWKNLDRTSQKYKLLKEERAEVLWRAVESVIPDVRQRVVYYLIGSPKTHERFLRRPMGTYGSATEDYLRDGSTPIENLFLCGDGIFPGIGVPAVALSGASAANALVSPLQQWKCLDKLNQKGLI
jgi:phytoene dehydrogenase-like protein